MLKPVVTEEKCTGCGACANKCPVNAIEMNLSQEGFYLAQIDSSLCIECGMCYKTCPAMNEIARDRIPQRAFAMHGEREHQLQSSSGGAFSQIASSFIQRGAAVSGASYTPDFHHVQHILIRSIGELKKIQGSKYLQSRAFSIFREIKTILEQGGTVLFSGVPCQVAGLYAFLEDTDITNLFSIDLICHSVPSAGIFATYLTEKFCERSICDLSFRDKTKGLLPYHFRIDFADGTQYRSTSNEDTYLQAFLNGLISNKVCHNCAYANIKRIGDITLGDYWGIEIHDKSKYSPLGTSLVLVNTSKGQRIFDETLYAWAQETPIEWAIQGNRTLSEPTPAHPLRDRFFDFLRKGKSVEISAMHTLSHHFDIGLVGIWRMENYGSALTYYSLYKYLNNCGFSVMMIERPKNAIWQPNDELNLFEALPVPAYDKADRLNNYFEMQMLNSNCDCFLVGSDQIWYPPMVQLIGNFAYLDFVQEHKAKVAYAVSFGHNEYKNIDFYQQQLAAYYINRFDQISVRELSGQSICEDVLGVKKAIQVMDPVFLIDESEYVELARQSNWHDKGYIAAYILDPNEEKEALLQRAACEQGKKLIVLSEAYLSEAVLAKWTLSVEQNVGVTDWLAVLHGADFIITDSFHGVCFSIIFRKPFICVCNNERGAARFETILSLAGLQDRMLESAAQTDCRLLLETTIDYDCVWEKLDQEIYSSKKWLAQSVTIEKEKKITSNDIVYQRLIELFSLQNEQTTNLINYNRRQDEGINSALGQLVINNKLTNANIKRLDGHDQVFKDIINQVCALNQDIAALMKELSDMKTCMEKWATQ